MAKPELGTKRIDPETGRKFYDLNRDPIVSPYTGKSYPRSYFESGDVKAIDEDEEAEAKEVDAEEDASETVSLEDAAGQASAELEQLDRARFMELIATGAVNELADLALWGDALSVLKAFRPELRPRARLSLLGVIFRSWLRR